MGAILDAVNRLGPFGCINMQIKDGTAGYEELKEMTGLEEVRTGSLSEFENRKLNITVYVFRDSDTGLDVNIIAGMDGILGKY